MSITSWIIYYTIGLGIGLLPWTVRLTGSELPSFARILLCGFYWPYLVLAGALSLFRKNS